MGHTSSLMRTGAMVAIALLSAMPSDARKPRPAPCPAGRFAIENGPLGVGELLAGATAVAVGQERMTLEGACDTVQAERIRLKGMRGKNKGSKVRALWRQCGGAIVQLTGRIDETCSRITGRIRVRAGRKRGAQSFTAVGAAPPTFAVDGTLTPAVPSVPGIDGSPSRRLEAASGAGGLVASFVEKELLVSTTDPAQLDGLLARWRGELVETFDLAAAGIAGAPTLHLVRIEAPPADLSTLAANVRSIDVDARGALRFSSPAALDLFAAAAAGAREGMMVSLNWIVGQADLAHGSTVEAPRSSPAAQPYTSDAFAWPYMTRGGAQDIGVGAAWQALLAAGRLSNRVAMAILDGGFQPTPDFPAQQLIRGGSGVENPFPCGVAVQGPCPFHGTSVVHAAMAAPDNGFGAAGPAGPVANLIAVQNPNLSIDNLVRSIRELGAYIGEVRGSVLGRARIINISGAVPIPAAGALFVDPILGAVFEALRDAGTLVFAAAGNETTDVDREDCILAGLICWEEEVWVPCESDGVLCVGGMRWDDTRRHPGSNVGTKDESDSVDLYGPFLLWVGPDPDKPDNPENLAHVEGGTSFSSPFVAGIAALVWAADPSLSADRVADILLGTAHRGGVFDGGAHQRRVNALAAVAEALGDDIPPLVTIDTPSPGSTHQWNQSISFQVSTEDLEGRDVSVSWRSDRDGPIGPGGHRFGFAGLSPGEHVISATATAGGASNTVSVEITVVNSPPVVAIVVPSEEFTYCTGELIDLEATVIDPNNDVAHPFSGDDVTWSIVGGIFLGSGFTTPWVPQAPGSRTVIARATDQLGLVGDDSVVVTVDDCVNARPQPAITSIPDVPGNGPDLEVDAQGTIDGKGYYDVTLVGSATDAEDGTIPGISLEWKTDRGDLQPGVPESGPQVLGNGSSLAVRLLSDCGLTSHRITLTATDSGGQQRSVSRVIEILLFC